MFSPDYSQLFADRTLLAERLSTSTLEPIAQQLISLITDIMYVRKGAVSPSPPAYFVNSETSATVPSRCI